MNRRATVAAACLLALCSLEACGGPQDGHDAVSEVVDASSDQPTADRADVSPDSPDTNRLDATDTSDVADSGPSDADDSESRVDAASDATDTGDGGCHAPGPTPTDVGRSCAAGTGVAAEYCREVFSCGGDFTMGETTSGFQIIDNPGMPAGPITTDDLHPETAHAGFVDAYEVTVARFRQWVLAGMPRPAVGSPVFNGIPWTSAWNSAVNLPDHEDGDVYYSPGPTPTTANCTWSPTAGVHDLLPINCVSIQTAMAFCWWDGKHLATEVGWEYVARNRGVDILPWGFDVAPIANPCMRGDVDQGNSCPAESLPQPVGTHPMGDTLDPPGVHDLFGGVAEPTFGQNFGYATISMYPVIPQPDGAFGGSGIAMYDAFVLRGDAWWQSHNRTIWLENSASREIGPVTGGRTAHVGIRCMRWDPEPR